MYPNTWSAQMAYLNHFLVPGHYGRIDSRGSAGVHIVLRPLPCVHSAHSFAAGACDLSTVVTRARTIDGLRYITLMYDSLTDGSLLQREPYESNMKRVRWH